VSRFALLLLAGCATSCVSASSGPVFPTSEHFPEVARAAPSFAAERADAEAETPSSEQAGIAGSDTSAPIHRVLVPVDSEAAHELVDRFFIAVLRESTRDLLPLFSAQASIVSEGNRQSAQAVWRARFAQLDYTSLSGRIVAPPQTLRTYTFASVASAKRDGVPAPTSPAEVVVVARPGAGGTSAGKTRLFGEILAFRLRQKPQTQAFEIAEIVEDFRLP
jgi:hypothetical protein